MDSTILRKLSYRSMLTFGKYGELTVEEMLNLNRTRYLRWCYYNLERISFIDEILEKIGIKGEYVICKPGKDSDLGLLLNKKMVESMHWKGRIKDKSRKKKMDKNS